MILIIDNYDSFTWNLVHRFGEIDPSLDIRVVRNDQVSCAEIEEMSPSYIVISPGPCTPTEAGISVEAVTRFSGKVPLLGVCLGHQSIGQATGGKIVRARELMHGKTDQIHHSGTGLFAGIESPMIATRYHSLVIQPDTLSDEFDMIGWAIDESGHREIMAVQHKTKPVFGLQFHPESFLTEHGVKLLANFLKVAG